MDSHTNYVFSHKDDIKKMTDAYDKVCKQRDGLLKACKAAYILHYPNPDDPDEHARLSLLDKRCKKLLVAAIAKVQPSKQSVAPIKSGTNR